ncbi:MORN repeat-containing protein [Leptospira noguchii]|uniref:Uncharacterized protein n=1 Tax=Leptospira noguchii TaxID=28182 RepID=A0A9Q8RN60_9LEPT|nr:hypothetical protein [Leptospira noguchii]TQE64438.1 hypothetical protein FF021_19805 [Leptospira noguchii]UOG29146.1 hypothetical protein MAL06_10530 [Leptospira noguchii]UOG54153.1 hypothetical protein MAL09_08785 [Leptospira noguchii]UOG55288.1 hypothetical protein MAL03_10140 [Leptospira noguchii]
MLILILKELSLTDSEWINKILTMFVRANVFISYSKNMILWKQLLNLILKKISTTFSIEISRNKFFEVMFLILIVVQCTSGDKRMTSNESADNGAGSSSYNESEVKEEQAESSSSSRSTSMETDRIRGCVQGDCVSGTGVYIYDNDDEYSGSFVNDLRNGSGRIKYKNGDRFEGSFKDDLRDGKGTYIFKNGAMLEGIFEMGKMIGPGKVRFPDTSIYEGDFQDEKNSAEGVMYSSFDHSKRHCRIENKIVLCGGPLQESGDIKPLH